MRRAGGSLLGLLIALLVAPGAGAAALEPVGTFDSPIFVTSEPADSDRLLVVEQGGRIVRSEHGVTTEVLDLTEPNPDLLVSGGEQGLLSAALAPDYAETGRLYVFYTRNGTGNQVGDLQIDEFTASGDSVPIASRRRVLTIDHEQFGNHNGGQLQFGPDGYLYIATGDGGGGGDPLESAQSLTSLLGKMLRIDPRRAGPAPYSIPPGNPFAGGVRADDEIWSYGLRNPWRFSFDRLTGDLLVGDVGQSGWEEVDYEPAPDAGSGVNFGWDCREGRHAFELDGCPGLSELTDPILEYPNPASAGAAITGGYVVRDPSVGDLYGRYLYADVYGGPVRSLIPALPDAVGSRNETLNVGMPVSFGEDSCARVYIASALGGVYRIVGDTPADCSATTPPPRPPPPPTPPAPPPGAEPAMCGGEEVTIGSPGPLEGTPGDDVIAGSDGADRIRGRGGDDLICALDGADRLRGGGGADRLRGGAGADRCRGGAGKNTLRSC